MVEEDKIVAVLLEFPFLLVAEEVVVTLVAEVAAEVLQGLLVVQVIRKVLVAAAAVERRTLVVC
jgi:hypothetical protein